MAAGRATAPALLPVPSLLSAEQPVQGAAGTTRAERVIEVALQLLTGGVCLFAVAYLLYACLPYTLIRSFADRLSSDGNAQSFTAARHHDMRLGAAAGAMGAGIVAAFLLRFLKTPRTQRAS